MLAIAAARLGYAPVLGLDHEAESVQAAAENAIVNGVGGGVEVRRFDLRREALPIGGEPASTRRPIVLANLVRPLLLDLAESMGNSRYMPAHLIASGLLREEADEVAAAFRDRVGLGERARRHGGEWAAVWLTSG